MFSCCVRQENGLYKKNVQYYVGDKCFFISSCVLRNIKWIFDTRWLTQFLLSCKGELFFNIFLTFTHILVGLNENLI